MSGQSGTKSLNARLEKFWQKVFLPPCYGRRGTRSIPDCYECVLLEDCIKALIERYRDVIIEDLSKAK